MKSGRPGHGFTDLEFEAEALRRVESEQRLLVTPQGEELVSPGLVLREMLSTTTGSPLHTSAELVTSYIKQPVSEWK